jgi:O-acetyl-ADP-ribose deacetylase (regulator of RNase III)
MSIQILHGDLIKLASIRTFDVIAHGCNCYCTMGAGIAYAIKRAFPEAYEADIQTIKGDKNKLGTCSFATIYRNSQSFIVVNAYTQFDYRGKGVKVDYDAVRACMRWIQTNFGTAHIGMPKIGAGLAGGDWSIIRNIINQELENITVVEFRKTF